MFLQLRTYYSGNKIAINSFFGDSFWTMFSQIVVVVVNFLSVVILANLFSQNDYGTFKLLTTWLAIATGLGYTGYIYTLPQKISSGEKYNLSEIYKKTFINSGLAFLALFVISIYYFFNQNFNLSVGFLFAAILGPILCISQIVNIYYMGRKEFRKFALVQNFVDLVQLLTLFILAYLKFDFLVIVSVYFSITILANLLTIFYTLYDDKKYFLSKVNKNISDEVLNDNQIEKETKIRNKLNISAIIFNFTSQIDKLLIFHFIGAAPLAIYSIVTAISDQARTPLKAFTAALFPRMSNQNFNLKKLYLIYTALTIVAVLIFLVLILIYPYIFKYFFPKYLEYVYLANIATIGVVFAPMQILYLYAQSKNQLNLINNYANINSVLQIVLYSLATYLGSILYLILFKHLINLVLVVYFFVKIK